MRNYILVVILCGFSVRTYLSQDSQVYTVYSGQPFDNVVQVSGFQQAQLQAQRQYEVQPSGNAVQGPYAVSNFQQALPQMRIQNEVRTQIPRQAEFEAQPLLYTQVKSQPLDNVVQGVYALQQTPPQAGLYSQLPQQTVFEVQSSDKVSQEPYGFTNFQQAPLQTRIQSPHQADYEIHQKTQYPTQNQYTNETANVNAPNAVRVIYINNGQQDPFGEIIKQILGPQSERLTSIQNLPAIQNTLPSKNSQSLRIQKPTTQFQTLPQQQQGYLIPISQQTSQDSDPSNRRQDQRLSQYQNLVVPSSEYTQQRQDQQNFASQHQTPQNERYTVIQVAKNPQASEEVPSVHYAYPTSKSPQNVNYSAKPQNLHQQGDYQQLSAFGNLQNASKLSSHLTEPTKKPFYINRFAADLYITRKPCEICCKDDELRPCTSCCNATALLNAKTLKTALG